MNKHRHVTWHFHATCNGWCNRDVRIYDLYGLKACSNILFNNLCHVHLTILKIGCHSLTQQCWLACTNEILEIWKLHILWNNFIKCARIFCKPSEQMFFCKGLISLKIRTNFVSVVKLLPVYNMASSGLWKMFTFIILNHQNGVWENVCLYNIDTYDLLYDFWQMLYLRCQGRCNLPGRC